MALGPRCCGHRISGCGLEHVGIYGYRAELLAGWPGLRHSELEGLEKLE